MTAAIPQIIRDKAIACGLAFIASETGEHRIQPGDHRANWYLLCHKGQWVLTVNDIPQITFRYEDAMKFLDRFAPGSSAERQKAEGRGRRQKAEGRRQKLKIKETDRKSQPLLPR
jgi:hypothetical protein